MSDPRYTPLRERHEALGASFTDFGGWQMPVRYTSDLAEHHAVRRSAGIFDISHMAEFLVTGESPTLDPAAWLERCLHVLLHRYRRSIRVTITSYLSYQSARPRSRINACPG